MSSKSGEALNESTNADAVEPASKKSRSSKSPFEEQVDAIEEECKKQENCGYMVVVGMDLDEDYEEASEAEKKRLEKALTQDEVDKFRIVLMPQKRADDFEVMEKLVLGDQYGGGFMMFNTRFSYEILGSFEQFKRMYNKAKDPKTKFNYIFGFTSCLDDYDVWMHDHEAGWGSECGGSKMISGLGRMWKNLFKKHSAEQLGLDKFSEPGVKAFLAKFKATVESVDMYDEPDLKFNY